MLVCQWGTPYVTPKGTLEGPAIWTPGIGTSFRLSDDIASGWQNVLRIMNEAIHINLKGTSGRGHVGDMDLLEVGNAGLTIVEQQSHFSIWALSKSALMISTNVQNMSAEALRILSNEEIIEINQDPLVEPAKLVQRFSGDHDIYAGPLANGDMAVLLLDHSNATRQLSLDFAALSIASANVTDLWNNHTATAARGYSAIVPPHGYVVLRLSNFAKTTPAASEFAYYPASLGVLTGNASLLPCDSCETGTKVGYLSANISSAVTLTGIRTSNATSDVRFSYLNCEVGYTFADQGPNVRGANVSVNGAVPQEVLFPLTWYDWLRDSLDNFLVRLSGFDTEIENNITVTATRYEGGLGLSGWAPDIDSIGVVR